jgi:signal transduction histidine kinase
MKFSDLKKSIDEKAQQKDAGSEKAKNLEFILNVVKSINQTLILDDVLNLVLKSAIEITESDRGFIVLRNSSGELEFKVGLDSSGNKLSEELFQVSTTVVEDVFETGQSRFVEAASSDNKNDPSKSILRLELQTILCSPLITDGKKIGVIYVDSKQLHRIRVKEITDTFEILAGQAATAIKNAQLYIGQVNANNALQEINSQLIQAERKALKSSINSEIGQALQGLVHLALLETESQMRTIEKMQKDYDQKEKRVDDIFFDRLKLKSKITIDSIRNIQKYAQVLIETSVHNLKKDAGDLNKTIQTVIKYLSPMKKYSRISFKTDFNSIPICNYDSDQIEHLLVQLISNSAEAKADATIKIKSENFDDRIQITLEDNGPGISRDLMKDFFELPSANKIGYGLFLCKSIVEQHRGEIEVIDSKEGTSIKFSLPLN